MSDKKKLELKSTASPNELRDHLVALAESFAKGRVVLEQGGRFVALEPAEQIELAVQAEQKKGKAKLCLEISWQAPTPASSTEPLRISSEVPDLPEPEVEDGEPGADELDLNPTA